MKSQQVISPILAVVVLLVASLASGCAEEPKEISLFTGTDLSGWKEPHGTWQTVKAVSLNPENPKAFQTEEGTGVLLNSPDGKTADFFTEAEFGDCELHVEFCVPKGSNSGVYLQGRYEVQILDSYGVEEVHYGDCGGIYQTDKEEIIWAGKAPDVNASKAPGEWQSFDIVFRAPRFDTEGKKTEDARFVKVTHNGTVIHENVSVPAPTHAAAFQDEKPLGPLKLQGDHGPVAYRNLRISPLSIE